MVYSYNYKQVKSSNSVNFTNFGSEITFDFKTDQLEHVDLLNSYLSVRLRIEQNATGAPGQANITCLRPLSLPSGADATTNDFIPYLSKNYLCGLFTTGKMTINDMVVSTISDIHSVNTLIRSVFDTPEIENTIDSTNPIKPLRIEDTIQPSANFGTYGQDAAQNFTIACPYTGKSKYAWDNMGMFKYYIENTCNMSLPFPLFMTGSNKEGLFPDNKIKMSFMVDPFYPTNIVQFTQNIGATVGSGINSITNLTSTWGCPANSIAVGIADLTLNLRIITKVNPLNEVRLLHLRQIFSQPHTLLSSNETFNLSAPKNNVKYVLACFLQTTRTGAGKSPSDFSDGFTGSVSAVTNETINVTGAVHCLQYIRFNYHGKQYPSWDYNIVNKATTICPTAGANTKESSFELQRLFEDVINNADCREDRCGSLYNVSSMAVEPIFCFKIADYPNSDDNNMLVSVKLDGAYVPSSSVLLTVCLYDEFVELTYDSAGKIISTILKS